MVDFSLREETAENFFGPDVVVVREMFNGEIIEETMPAALAVLSVLDDDLNGVVFKRARIVWSGVFDEWGQSR